MCVGVSAERPYFFYTIPLCILASTKFSAIYDEDSVQEEIQQFRTDADELPHLLTSMRGVLHAINV